MHEKAFNDSAKAPLYGEWLRHAKSCPDTIVTLQSTRYYVDATMVFAAITYNNIHQLLRFNICPMHVTA